MSAHTLRKKFVVEFSGLRAYSRLVATTIVGSYILQIVIAVALGFFILKSSVTLAKGLSLAFLIFFIGTRLRGINNIVHECCHFSFTDRRGDNIVFGRLCASLILGCFSAYRAQHMTHHAYLGDYEKDLDLQGIQGFRLEEPLTAKTIVRHALTPVFALHLPKYLTIDLSARDGRTYLLIKLGLLAVAVFLLILDPVAAILLVWIPYVWIFTAINYWTDCVDHGGLLGKKDELALSRSLALPTPLRLILFPRNDCYHLEHHLFPRVPARHLGKCNKILEQDPSYFQATKFDAPSSAQPRLM